MQSAILTPEKFLTPDEERELLRLLEKYKDEDLRNTTALFFILKTGLRPSEVCNLTWPFVDMKQRTIHVKTLKRGPDRILPIPNQLWHRLSKLDRNPNDPRVFGFGYQRFWQIWRMYRPVEKSLHSLRHTFAVNVFNKSGHNLGLTQQALGHAKISTTSVYLSAICSLNDLKHAMCE